MNLWKYPQYCAVDTRVFWNKKSAVLLREVKNDTGRRHDMVWYDTALHDMEWHDMVWHDAIEHGTTWHNITWHDLMIRVDDMKDVNGAEGTATPISNESMKDMTDMSLITSHERRHMTDMSWLTSHDWHVMKDVPWLTSHDWHHMTDITWLTWMTWLTWLTWLIQPLNS